MPFVLIDRLSGDVLRRINEAPTNPVYNKGRVWLELIRSPRPNYDATTHKLVAEIIQPDLSDLSTDVDPSAQRQEGWIIVALTQQELDELKITDAHKDIANSASRQAMWVLAELIDKLLAQGTIQATDFTPNVRSAYQTLKNNVDEVKN